MTSALLVLAILGWGAFTVAFDIARSNGRWLKFWQEEAIAANDRYEDELKEHAATIQAFGDALRKLQGRTFAPHGTPTEQPSLTNEVDDG